MRDTAMSGNASGLPHARSAALHSWSRSAASRRSVNASRSAIAAPSRTWNTSVTASSPSCIATHGPPASGTVSPNTAHAERSVAGPGT
jgi:hypothetical protein